MKIRFLLFWVLNFGGFSQITLAQAAKPVDPAEKIEIKEYFFVMLTAGPNRAQDSAEAAKIQEGHMNNIRRLVTQGKIIVAGPFDDGDKWRGLFIFNCETKQQVEEYLKTDPAISSGRLAYDIHPWWTGKNCLFK